MAQLWFVLVALLLAMYVLFDGFDLGAGAIHPFVATSEDQKRMLYRSIGPVWDGNEVWLLAAGGTLFFTFPPVYAAGFSEFLPPVDDGFVVAHVARTCVGIACAHARYRLG